MPDSLASTSAFDRAWVLAQIGEDEELLHEIAAVFLIDSPDLRQKLAADLARNDALSLHSTAHCAKSAIGNFGASAAVAAAIELENAAKASDTARLPALTETLCAEMLRVEDALRLELQTSTS